VKRLFALGVLVACCFGTWATGRASQPGDAGPAIPEPITTYPVGTRYYGSIDPNPIGYYPYSYYQGPAFPVTRAYGYYPYPDPHPYPPPFFYPYGYLPYGGYFGPYGYYGGYGVWPYYGYPGWGWGTVSSFGFGF
jgi:hypothetical protein